eukprot:TRINITY_DN15694_c0_g1_i2.p1 TRINITY_DN15694_c0_g1~~TRINITY_DN15694_c0_g1_i2.p1  ORF type:complete len:169 (+),score=35.08 TRINITY_DN15694_c0_g1_i2:110-616(+)
MAPYNVLLALLFLFPINIAAQCTLTPDTENVVGTQLAGDWTINLDLTNQLWPDFMEWVEVTGVSFTNNPEIVDTLPEDDCNSWMIDFQLFQSGEMTFKFGNNTDPEPVSYPFVLSSLSGNPHLIYWLDDMTDTESFNLMLARADDQNNDLLFLGGDFNSQPFSAWKRV